MIAMDGANSNNWILRFPGAGQPKLRLFCFPYAGGSAYAYRPWRSHLPAEIDLCGIEPPGRYERLREPPYRRASALVEDLFDVVEPLLDVPFALFGHSMGALLALQFAYELRARGLSQPRHLFLSARPAPHTAAARTSVHTLEDPLLWQVVDDIGGVPATVRNDAGYQRMFAPLFRADMELVETYQPDEAPLDVPLTALGGTSDVRPPPDQLVNWSAYSSRFSQHLFPGDHFYLRSEEPAVVRFVASQLGFGSVAGASACPFSG